MHFTFLKSYILFLQVRIVYFADQKIIPRQHQHGGLQCQKNEKESLCFSAFFTLMFHKKRKHLAGIVKIEKRHISNSRTETKGFDF